MDLRLEGAEGPFPPDVALSLYRIVQEALANTVRHAGAQTATVALRAAAGTARLTVTDDGRGFDPGAAREALLPSRPAPTPKHTPGPCGVRRERPQLGSEQRRIGLFAVL